MDSSQLTGIAVPQPEEITVSEREDAMGAYLMMFASLAAGLPLPIINLVASIVYYFVNREKGKFVHFHCLHSLYAQIPSSLLNAGGMFWGLRIVFDILPFDDTFKAYLIVVALANLLYFAFSIVAAVRARQGRFFYFVFFGKIAFQQVYGADDRGDKEKTISNKAPKF
jgi:uncharacterized membrane protein